MLPLGEIVSDLSRTKGDLIAELVGLRRVVTRQPPSASPQRADAVRKSLQASEVKFRRLFEAARDGILILDAETGVITAVNPFLAELLGYTRKEMLGVKLWELGPFADIKDSKYAFRELQRNRYIRYDDLPLETKDGRIIAVEFVSNVYSAGGQQVIQCNVRDITERVQTTKRLQLLDTGLLAANQALALRATIGLSLTTVESLGYALQQCADAMVAHLGVAVARIWTLDKGAGMLELKASASVNTDPSGLPDRVSVGKSMIGLIAERREPSLTNALTDDPRYHTPDWARREGIVAFAGHPLMVDARVVGVMAVYARHPLTDATTSALASVADHIALGIERRRSAEALRIAEERTRFALEGANVGTWDLDMATGVCHWSEIIEAQYGLLPGTFGETFEAFIDLVHPEDRAAVLETIRNAETAGTDFATLNRATGLDGSTRWIQGLGHILCDKHGTPIRTLGISLDVTKRHNLEAQVRQSQKMESVGRLAGGVAHDFNNLLTVILGEAELASGSLQPGSRTWASLEEIRKAGRRAADLTRRLLTFSRQQIHTPTVFDANELVTGIDTMLQRLIGENVILTVRLCPTPAWVTLDRGDLEQVLMNLVVNAQDAMPDGGELTIETAIVTLDEEYAKLHADVRPGSYVQVAVSDSGIGMTRDVQAHLFEPFFTTKPPGKGTGLGLATSYGIVKAAGGHIAVYSELGIGTTVRMHLPLAGRGELHSEPVTPECHQGNGEVILLVEDESQVRRVGQLMLEACGYRVLQAADGEEALAILTHGPETVDVLLTDVVMTGMNGGDLAERAAAIIPGIRVLFATGYSGAVIDRHRLLEHGARVIQKPFTKESLARSVREALDSPRC